MVKVIGQAGVKFAKQQVQKSKPESASKFEQKRAQLEKRQAENASLSPEVTQISPEQKRILESNLRKRIEQGNAEGALKVDLRKARTKFEGVSKQVTAAPKTPAFDAVRKRLDGIDAQFQETDKLMKGLDGSESPREMLQIQMKIYKMTQNIEIVTKCVEQSVSGFKTIMQTQV
jgi:hypothetical protein